MDASLLSSLIGDLYDAAIDPLLWSGIAARIAGAFQSTSAVVKLHGGEAPFQLVETTANLVVPERLGEWAERWHRHDLWVERSVAFGMNRVVTDEMLVTPDEQQKTGYYREWLRYLDIHHMVGAVFPTGSAAIGVLGIHRPREAGAFTGEDQGNVALLLPHLKRALDLSQSLSRASAARTLSHAALDRLEIGVMMVAPAAQLRHANAEAERMLAAGEVVSLRSGRLVAIDPPWQDPLAALVRATIDAAARRSPAPTAVLALPRSGRLPVTLAALPLPADPSPLGQTEPHALLFLRDPERHQPRADHLASLFGLTPTEAAIAAELGAGRAPEAIAAHLHIGIGTLRWHLKRILAKTHTSRQAELVALLLRSVASIQG